MREHTHREYLMWQLWLDEENNQPNKSDYYMMQVAQYAARIFKKNPRKIKLEHFKLSFRKKQRAEPISVEEATTQSKSRWFGLTGFKRK